MTHYFYRTFPRRAMAVLLLVLLTGSFSVAQLRDRTEHNPPPDPATQPAPRAEQQNRARALAVVEFLQGKVRLVPIALWVDNKFYDASLYGANPEPLSIEPQTVYQATDYGEPTGLFTVTTPEQLNGNWIAEGYWKPQSAFDIKMAENKAKQATSQPAHSRAVMTNDPDEGRPTLKRAPGSGGDSTSSSSQGSAPSTNQSAGGSSKTTAGSGGSSGNGASASPGSSTSSGGSSPSANGRPTLSRPGEPTDLSTSSDSTSSNDASQTASSKSKDDDPDRPTLKTAHSSETSSPAQSSGNSNSASSQSSATSEGADENDPDRPVLERGKPAKQIASTDLSSPPMSTKPSSAGGSAGATGSKGALRPARAYPAISDPGNYEMRSLLYAISPEDRKDKGSQMAAMALADIRAFSAKRNSPPLPKTAVISDYELRAFDLDFSNSPTLVLTAKVPVPGKTTMHGAEFDYYVTVVAHLLTDGTPQKIFSSVTDYNHLDAFPRLELIDAVDADANGRGDLLFRQYSDTGVNYGLYRVFPYQMQKVFEGGSSM